mgnify:FL=1
MDPMDRGVQATDHCFDERTLSCTSHVMCLSLHLARREKRKQKQFPKYETRQLAKTAGSRSSDGEEWSCVTQADTFSEILRDTISENKGSARLIIKHAAQTCSRAQIMAHDI